MEREEGSMTESQKEIDKKTTWQEETIYQTICSTEGQGTDIPIDRFQYGFYFIGCLNDPSVLLLIFNKQ